MTQAISASDLPARLLLTEAELATRWNVSRRTLQRLRQDGRLPAAFRVGRKVLYRLDSVTAFECASSTMDEV